MTNLRYIVEPHTAPLPVFAANTVSATLVTPELVQEAITVIGATIPAGLSKSVTVRELPNSTKPKSDAVMKIVASVGATLVDPTNYEQGDAVINALTESPHYICVPWNASNADRSGGLRPVDLMAKAAEAFANSFWGRIAALFTSGNFAVSATVAPGLFGLNEIATLLDKLKAFPQKHLILRGDYFGRLVANAPYLQRLPNGAWVGAGFDQISIASDWTAAEANVVGIGLSPSAIAVGTGLPVRTAQPVDFGVTLSSTRLQVMGLEGFEIAFYGWFALQSRSAWNSFDAYVSAGVADTAAAFLIKTQ